MTYEENLAAVLRKQAEFAELFKAEAEWGQAHGAPAEFVELYKGFAQSNLATIEDLLDAHFEALGDDPPKR
jgi:hypothetical protein